jgi:hypothetical protein
MASLPGPASPRAPLARAAEDRSIMASAACEDRFAPTPTGRLPAQEHRLFRRSARYAEVRRVTYQRRLFGAVPRPWAMPQ